MCSVKNVLTRLFKKLVHKMQAAFSGSAFWLENTFIDHSVHFAILIAGKTFEDALFESSLFESSLVEFLVVF